MRQLTKFSKKLNNLLGKGGKYETQHRRKDVPSSYFLMEKARKYPYKTPDGKVSRQLLVAAIHRAAQYGHTGIMHKAQELLDKYFPKKNGKRFRALFKNSK